jgi:hypothetical protein
MTGRRLETQLEWLGIGGRAPSVLRQEAGEQRGEAAGHDALLHSGALFVFLMLLAQAPGPAIVERPIPFTDARREAMLEYRRRHEDPAARDLAITPRVLIIHHTALNDLEASYAAFEAPFLGQTRPRLAKAGGVNVSAHFLVDRDGTILRLLPETQMGRHTIGLNHVAIGIENVGGTAKTRLTDAQLAANAALVRWLAARHPITHLIGHHEYRGMERHEYWRERDPSYRTIKQDPGATFMSRLRAKVADLALLGQDAGL